MAAPGGRAASSAGAAICGRLGSARPSAPAVARRASGHGRRVHAAGRFSCGAPVTAPRTAPAGASAAPVRPPRQPLVPAPSGPDTECREPASRPVGGSTSWKRVDRRDGRRRLRHSRHGCARQCFPWICRVSQPTRHTLHGDVDGKRSRPIWRTQGLTQHRACHGRQPWCRCSADRCVLRRVKCGNGQDQCRTRDASQSTSFSISVDLSNTSAAPSALQRCRTSLVA